MIVSLLVFLAAVWVLVPLLGNHGLWLAFYGFMIARALTLGVAYPALLRAVPVEVQ
jgi:MATE family multidrug resistance protein